MGQQAAPAPVAPIEVVTEAWAYLDGLASVASQRVAEAIPRLCGTLEFLVEC